MGFAVTAQACDMRTAARASAVADYAEQGLDCLSAPTPGYRFDDSMEQAFIGKINQERTARGLTPLIVRDEVRPAARFHSLDMGVNSFFGHKSPKGKTHAARVAAFDRTLLPQASAENVAQLEMQCMSGAGLAISCAQMPEQTTDPMAGAVAELHRQLMQSAGHRKNILAPETTHIALGVARTDFDVYVTQIFVQPAGFLNQPLPLRLKAGHKVKTTATAAGWDIKRFALMLNNMHDDMRGGLIPADIVGDRMLSVRGERSGKTTRNQGRLMQSYEFIYLNGPAFTVQPSTESSRSASGAS